MNDYVTIVTLAKSSNDPLYSQWANAVSEEEFSDGLLNHENRERSLNVYQKINSDTSSSQFKPPIAQKSKRKQSSDHSSQPSRQRIVVNEVDGVFFPGLSSSIGSFIGTLASNSQIFDRKSRYFVTLGMNGILDMTDITAGSQLSQLPEEASQACQNRTLWRFMMERIGFTLKRTKAVEERRDTSKTIQERYEYVVQRLPERGISYKTNWIFVDEAGFNANLIRGQGYSKKGSTSVVVNATKRAVNMSILAAISYHGVEGVSAPAVKELFKNSNHHMCLLPPYSPFLSPIEECFSKMKTLVKRKPHLKGSINLSTSSKVLLRLLKKTAKGGLITV
ncbi:hypothetical protein [Parasitella parasitica]|uniref:Tc1-like transposase DDE domain-containing protein n=1 Tax=Parasitella parasitica TaxID=35722 RepID=A0A0B7NEC5_9FUNG|nr:hypothetical protein [Parasitella parasitica]